MLTWLIGRRLFGTLVATLAAVLLAASPLAVYYSQEVRMYAQVTALGLLAVYAYARRWPGCTRWPAWRRCTRSTWARRC